MAQAQTLRALATAKNINIGAAVTFPTGSTLATYDSTLSQQFNAAVCENAMKWGNLQAVQGKFTFTGADAIVNFAQSHNLKMRGHNFIWHQQSGFIQNLTTATVSRDSMFKIMKTHIDTVMKHYKGKIYEWDIVNEATARDSVGLRDGSGIDTSRWATITDAKDHNFDYIDSAYTYARQADSSVFLVYNDYNAEGMGKKSNLVYNLVAHLKSLNILDGVGLQCHFHLLTDTGVNGGWVPSEMASNLQRLAALGLRISMTEVDIRIRTPASAADTTEQRKEYQTLMGLCVAQPNCKTFTTWGVNDAQSWIPGSFSGYGSALLFDNNFNPKPDYYGVEAALSGTTGILEARNGRLRMTSLNGAGPAYDLRGRKLSSLPYNPNFIVEKPAVGNLVH